MIDKKFELIAVDTEYHCDKHGIIDRVWCVCGTALNGKTFKVWTGNGVTPRELWDTMLSATGYTSPTFVCHAYDKAERRAFKYLGFIVKRMRFVDTYHLARMLQTSTFDKKVSEVSAETDDADEIANFIARKAAKAAGLSYAGLCEHYDLALVDTVHKAAMRQLCIDATTNGHEDEIMQYCLEDTAFLLPMLDYMLHGYEGQVGYTELLHRAFCPLDEGAFERVDDAVAIERLVEQCRYITIFGNIADKGLPLSEERVSALERNAVSFREHLKEEFNERWPIFTRGRNGVWHEDTKATQAQLVKCIEQFGEAKMLNYPKTARGYSTNKDVLKEHFKGHDECFGEQYRQLNKLLKQLGSVAKVEISPFDAFFDGCLHYESLNPYGTTTGRCAPSTRRFLFGWHKSLYGLLDPPEGKWLVELDYGSEETFCQCAICKDPAYNRIYASKDIYMAFAVEMGLIPRADFETMTKEQLKEKYGAVRKKVKPMVLGLSYGMGAKKLAKQCGFTDEESVRYHTMITQQILHVSSDWKRRKLNPSAKAVKAFALPDGWLCAYHYDTANRMAVGNWSFQSAGSMILRRLVEELDGKGLDIRATIHDAIFFMVDEGDNATIEKVAQYMRAVANKTLRAPSKWSMKVGDPEIIRHGEVWTPEHAFDADFNKLAAFVPQGQPCDIFATPGVAKE